MLVAVSISYTERLVLMVNEGYVLLWGAMCVSGWLCCCVGGFEKLWQLGQVISHLCMQAMKLLHAN